MSLDIDEIAEAFSSHKFVVAYRRTERTEMRPE